MTKTNITPITAVLDTCERLKNTHVGNPVYLCRFVTEDGDEFLARTVPNSQFAYAVTNYRGDERTFLFRPWRGEMRVVGVQE